MPDPARPAGVDYCYYDRALLSGTETFPPQGSPDPLVIDWQTHADMGVRFAILKARHAQWTDSHAPFFSANYTLVKNAGLLRTAYHWLHPCEVQIPANKDDVTSANWHSLPIIVDPIEYALQQANDFCDQILEEGWGEPGDLPPAVDIESSVYVDAGCYKAPAVLLDSAGRPIFEDTHGNLIGAIDMVGGVKVVIDSAGVQLGRVQYDGHGHPAGILDAAGNVIRTGRLRREDGDHPVADLWHRMPNAQSCIDVIVVWLAQVERRLAEAVPGRPVRPIIYSANTWREWLGSPTDNGGSGWDVNHNGINYHVANFADYPNWFAQYPTNPSGVTQLSSFPATWATQGKVFIWQYKGDPDRSALMRITNVAPGSGSSVRTITVEELTDLSWLEELAGIKRLAARRALTRISPAPVDDAPERSFNLLLLGQGFSAAGFPSIAQRLWTDPDKQLYSLTNLAPFGALRDRSRVACYADDGTGVFLRMRQAKSNMPDDELSIPSDAATLLRDYLSLLEINPVNGPGTGTPAESVWLQQRRQTGPAGGLIAILRNGRKPARTQSGDPPPVVPVQDFAELYQLDPSENYPVPVVAVNVTWGDQLWPQLIIRALAQNLGGLRDEFELPGDAFEQPAVELERLPSPNLLFMDLLFTDKTEREWLASAATAPGATVPPAIAEKALQAWRLPAGTALDFYPYGTLTHPAGDVHLVEGGGGYRHQVLRSDFDCLMRRMPVTIAKAVTNPSSKPVRDFDIQFCRVCREWLEAILRGEQEVRVGGGVRLDTQRIAYDWVNWKTREEPPAGFDPARSFHRVHTMEVAADEPKWSMTIDYNPRAGSSTDCFRISAVQLSQRPDDPYARAVDILRLIRFQDLSVTYSVHEKPGDSPTTKHASLAIDDALKNTRDPPRLDLASDGGADRAWQLGARLTLAWPFSGKWTHHEKPVELFTVEAVLGLLLSGEQHLEPSFPVRGCKVLPQLALRVRPSFGPVTVGRGTAGAGVAANVSELKGSVVIEAVNAIAPDSSLDSSLAPLATGRLGATLVCQSNTAMADSKMAPVSSGLVLPASGRKLAGMRVDANDLGAATRPFIVGPPAWSWRYDQVRALGAAGSRATVAAAFHSNESKGAALPPAGTAPPLAARKQSFTWPAGSTFQMTVYKFQRQGAYDVLYIHPVGTETAPVPPIPICGDLGLVLWMRQGASESTMGQMLPLLGWGPGRLEGGAGTSIGAPLVPPNQHVDLTVERLADGVVGLTYAAMAQEFGADEWQVFLEQGLGIGYRYDVQSPGALAWLRAVASFAGLEPAALQALATALADSAHPEALDLQVRALFRALHAAACVYDQQIDGITAQQAPAPNDLPTVESL